MKKNKKSSSKSHANNNAASGNQIPVGDPVMLSTEGKSSFEIEPQFCYPRKIDDIVKSAKFIALHIGEYQIQSNNFSSFITQFFTDNADDYKSVCSLLQVCFLKIPIFHIELLDSRRLEVRSYGPRSSLSVDLHLCLLRWHCWHLCLGTFHLRSK